MGNLPIRDASELKNLIIGGKNNTIDYTIKYYQKVKEEDITVKLRPLSTYEFDKISLDMYSIIEDEEVIDYLFSYSDEEIKADLEKEKEEAEKEEEESEEKPKTIPKNATISRYRAYLHRNVLIAFYSMKDFINDLTIELIEQFDGDAIDEIATKINEISGRTPEMLEKVSQFRKESKEPNNKESVVES